VRKVLEGAETITANSEWTKRKIIENYFSNSKLKTQNSKLLVVYPEPKPKREAVHGEVRKLRLELGIPEGAKVLLTVARLVARKGIGRVLNALPEVWKTIPNLHYVIVGDGEESSQLLVVSRQLWGSERIHFVGVVSDEELAAYYSMADAFILLPREEGGDAEGFGIVYVEANQYGMPIIGCICGGTGEALSQCQRVVTVIDPDNSVEVSEKICQAFQ
jgi:phosphatidylinositol alpha-1,6-mannosyltransferase